MTRLDDALQQFRANLKLRPGFTQQVNERRDRVFEILRARWRTPEVIPIGSYARGTVDRPLEDIDLMFVLEPQATQARDPLGVLREVHAALRQYYPNTRLQRRSVGLRFEDFSIDVVPVLATADAYQIADIEPNDQSQPARWILTNPRAHTQRVATANQRTNGSAADLVAMLKSANRAHSTRLKSFHLEVMVLDALDAGEIPSSGFPQAVHEALKALATRVNSACRDPAGAKARLDEYLDAVPRAEIARRYSNDAGTFAEAIRRDDVALARKVISRLP